MSRFSSLWRPVYLPWMLVAKAGFIWLQVRYVCKWLMTKVFISLLRWNCTSPLIIQWLFLTYTLLWAVTVFFMSYLFMRIMSLKFTPEDFSVHLYCLSLSKNVLIKNYQWVSAKPIEVCHLLFHEAIPWFRAAVSSATLFPFTLKLSQPSQKSLPVFHSLGHGPPGRAWNTSQQASSKPFASYHIVKVWWTAVLKYIVNACS